MILIERIWINNNSNTTKVNSAVYTEFQTLSLFIDQYLVRCICRFAFTSEPEVCHLLCDACNDKVDTTDRYI